MKKLVIAAATWLGMIIPLHAHQIWIEQADGQNAIVPAVIRGEDFTP